MLTFSVNTIIDKPVDIVVKALMDPDNFPFWQTDLERFEIIKETPDKVGSIGHLHYNQKGRTYILEDKMIFCDPGKKYISEVSGYAIKATVETILNTVDNKTEMTIKWSGKGNILILKIIFPFLRGNMIKQSKAELETFKKLVETHGSNFAEKKKKIFNAFD